MELIEILVIAVLDESILTEEEREIQTAIREKLARHGTRLLQRERNSLLIREIDEKIEELMQEKDRLLG